MISTSNQDVQQTNLGKWGKITQTYREHGHAVWVFRALFLTPLFKVLTDALKKRGLSGEDIQEIKTDYLGLIQFETYNHDYDKLYIPANMLGDLGRFRWHGDVESQANKLALKRITDDTRQTWNNIASEEVTSSVLKSANVSHEGILTPEKLAYVFNALGKFFKETYKIDVDTASLDKLTKSHVYSLRVADSIASAEIGVAYKDDVSKVVNLFQALDFSDHCIYVIAVSFNPVFSQSKLATVLSAYYEIYDDTYKWLKEWVEFKGTIIADNVFSIVAIYTASKSENDVSKALLAHFKEKYDISESMIKDICAASTAEVDFLNDPTNFDQTLKSKIMDAFAVLFPLQVTQIGLPCASCGRPIVNKLTEGKTIENKFLKDEVDSLETRGDFGFIASATKDILHIELGKNPWSNMILCESCIAIGELTKEFSLGTIAFGSVKREYRRKLRHAHELTNEKYDPLVSLLFSHKLKQEIIDDIRNQAAASGSSAKRIAGSVLLVNFTSTISGIFGGVIDPLTKGKIKSETLPDAEITYAIDVGIRFGTGALILNNMVYDHEFLKGIFQINEYSHKLLVAQALEEKLLKWDAPRRKLALIELQKSKEPTGVLSSLIKIDIDTAQRFGKLRKIPQLRLEELEEIVIHVLNYPESINTLRTMLGERIK